MDGGGEKIGLACVGGGKEVSAQREGKAAFLCVEGKKRQNYRKQPLVRGEGRRGRRNIFLRKRCPPSTRGTRRVHEGAWKRTRQVPPLCLQTFPPGGEEFCVPIRETRFAYLETPREKGKATQIL